MTAPVAAERRRMQPFSVSIKSSPKGHKKSTAEAMLLKPYY